MAGVLAGCASSGSDDLAKKVEAAFAAEGVAIHEQSGLYSGGPDQELVPNSRAKFGDFVVYVIKNKDGFASAEASTSKPDAAGIRWNDALAQHNPPYFTSYKRYGSTLELQWSNERRSVDDGHWRALDAILRRLQ